MMKPSQMYKLMRKFVRQNVPIVFFISIIFFVGVIILFKVLTAQEETVYAKVKVSQGLWWASTAKPSVWLAQSFKKGMVETDLTGKPVVEVLSVRSYPWWNSEQYDIYLTLKIQASKNERTKIFTFKRAPIAVGSPIDLEFPEVQVSGTVIELSEKPISDNKTTKIVTLEKKYANQWEIDAIAVGDTYYDGVEQVAEILEKEVFPSSEVYVRVGNVDPFSTEDTSKVVVTVQLYLEERNNELIYREEQPVQPGRILNFQTSKLVFQDYIVTSIK